jgi:membrane-bound ClpP family serine protease
MDSSLVLAYVLIVAGLLLLVAELFIPSGGVLMVVSLGVIVVGVAMTFNNDNPAVGLVTLLLVFVAVPTVFGLMLHYWPRTRMGRRFFLKGPEDDATIASMPVHLELEQLRGRFGRAVSSMRPAGVVDFDGKRVDCITEGIMLDPEQWVRCIDVQAGRVIVRAVDRPDLEDLEKAFTE